MAVIKAITIPKEEYEALRIIARKYQLIVNAITCGFMSEANQVSRIDEITEDTYKFKKGE